MESRLSSVNVHQVQEKIRSKKELYDFLTQDCGAYLPKIGSCNIYFLKSIINGEKEYLKRSDIIIAAVPQIEGLSAEDFLEFAKNKPSLLSYLPDQCDWLHLDKKWICDVLMSLDNSQVNTMILEAKQRDGKNSINHRILIVHMRPEFADALSRSLNFSVQKGRSAHLIKSSSNRKRRTADLEEVKEEEVKLNQSKQKYLEENKRMKNEFNSLRDQIEELHNYKELVHQLHDNGVIDDNGNMLAASNSNQFNLME